MSAVREGYWLGINVDKFCSSVGSLPSIVFVETLFNILSIRIDRFRQTALGFMKLAPSNRTLAILFIVILVVSLLNTFLIVYSNYSLQKRQDKDIGDLNQALNKTSTFLSQTDLEIQNLLNGKIENVNARLPIGQYDYVIYRYWNYNSNVSDYLAKSGRTGLVEFNHTDAASVFNNAIANGNSIYIKSDEYNITSNVCLNDKKNARLDSDGARLIMNGNKIILNGTNYETSQCNQISGLVVLNGTLRIQNSFRTTVTNMIFEKATVGLELANTMAWTECTKIDTVFFEKCAQGLVFRTNISSLVSPQNVTGSYANTEINRCYFNQLDNSIAITVEKHAEFTDSLMQDVRIWMGENGKYNQTGLLLNGSMYKTLMNGVVFESFAPQPLSDAYFYAIKIGDFSFHTPIMESGVNFLGNWTARISNSDPPIWVFGVGGIFKLVDVDIPVGSSNYGEVKVIQIHPATIATFQPKITVIGNFAENETVTVRFRLEFVDNSVTNPTYAVQKSFYASGSIWLTNDELMQLYPSLNVIYAILVDAKVSSAQSNAVVRLDLFGTTT